MHGGGHAHLTCTITVLVYQEGGAQMEACSWGVFYNSSKGWWRGGDDKGLRECLQSSRQGIYILSICLKTVQKLLLYNSPSGFWIRSCVIYIRVFCRSMLFSSNSNPRVNIPLRTKLGFDVSEPHKSSFVKKS